VSVQTIRDKTAKLRKAKERHNSLVRAVDSELEEKLSRLGERTVHVPLALAHTCVESLTKNRSLLPEVLEELQQILEFSSIGDDESDIERPPRSSQSPATSPASSSSSDSPNSRESGASQGQISSPNSQNSSAHLPTTRVSIVEDAHEEEEEEDDLSGNDEMPSLRSIDLDTEEFLKQHGQAEDFGSSD
jgi:hypothetical protein